MIKIAYSDRFVLDLPEGHKFPMIKYELIKEQLIYEGSISLDQLFEPLLCEDPIVAQTHDPEYLFRLWNQQLTEMEIRKIGFPFTEMLVKRCFTSTQGTLQCALYALENGVALNTAGGTHHAFSNRGEGFCVINDIAVAANYLIQNGIVKKVLIIDLDVHQGNGTASIFKNNTSVFTFSMHGADNYPLKKESSDLDVPLAAFIGDNEYIAILKYHLPQLFSQHKPDFVFYLSGVDVLETDKLGKLALSKYGCKVRDELVLNYCYQLQIPVAVAMGGGYSAKVADTVDAHCNTFRTAISIW